MVRHVKLRLFLLFYFFAYLISFGAMTREKHYIMSRIIQTGLISTYFTCFAQHPVLCVGISFHVEYLPVFLAFVFIFLFFCFDTKCFVIVGSWGFVNNFFVWFIHLQYFFSSAATPRICPENSRFFNDAS